MKVDVKEERYKGHKRYRVANVNVEDGEEEFDLYNTQDVLWIPNRNKNLEENIGLTFEIEIGIFGYVRGEYKPNIDDSISNGILYSDVENHIHENGEDLFGLDDKIDKFLSVGGETNVVWDENENIKCVALHMIEDGIAWSNTFWVNPDYYDDLFESLEKNPVHIMGKHILERENVDVTIAGFSGECAYIDPWVKAFDTVKSDNDDYWYDLDKMVIGIGKKPDVVPSSWKGLVKVQ